MKELLNKIYNILDYFYIIKLFKLTMNPININITGFINNNERINEQYNTSYIKVL